MNQQGSQKIDAYRRASNYPAAGQLYLPDTPLLRRPLKREDVKRKLIAHKNCIHEIGQDMPEILDRKRHLPEKLYTFISKKAFHASNKLFKSVSSSYSGNSCSVSG